MGRKGSKLIPFLKEGLRLNKYRNLKYEDVSSQTFSLNLPQKSSRLALEPQFILQDWYKLKNHEYEMKKDYTQAKQGMEAAIRKSDFLELVRKERSTFTYRILTAEEVKIKKMLKKALKKVEKAEPVVNLDVGAFGNPDEDASANLDAYVFENPDYASSPGSSSGYGSGSDNVEESYELDSNHTLLHAFNHDHEYFLRLACEMESPQPMQLDCDENVNCPTDTFPIKIESMLYENNVLLNQQEGYAAPNPEIENAVGSLNSFQDSYVFPNELNNLLIQDSVMDGINLNPPFNADFLFPNAENAKLMDDLINSLGEELLPDLGESSKITEIPAESDLEITLCKSQMCKVYESINCLPIPEMVIVTCQPKMREFCISNADANKPSHPRFLFDEATLQSVSNCTFDRWEHLTDNDHLLVFFKVQRAD